MNTNVAALIIVYNEELHLSRCLKSIEGLVDEIHIIDSYSSDKTIEIATRFQAKIYQVQWQNSYSKKYNWGLDNVKTKCEWILRLDADEVCSSQLRSEIRLLLSPSNKYRFNAVKVPRTIKFLGRELRYGAMQPIYTLRLFKAGLGVCESKLMDEHIVVENETSIHAGGKIIDENLKGWDDWIAKHNTYALKEAIDLLQRKKKETTNQLADNSKSIDQVRRKRILKHWYEKLPLFIRPVLYFIYRYIVRGGFRDGFSGFSWHFLQGLWYRMLVDIKVYEISRELDVHGVSLERYVQERYGFDISFDNEKK